MGLVVGLELGLALFSLVGITHNYLKCWPLELATMVTKGVGKLRICESVKVQLKPRQLDGCIFSIYKAYTSHCEQ